MRQTFAMFAVAIMAAQIVIPASASGETVDEWRGGVVSRISGEEIMSTIEDLEDFGTRDFHTAQSLEAANYIHDKMEALGLSTTLQEFTVGNITAVNVVGTLNAELNDQGFFVIGAHYDSENRYVTNQSEAENYTAPGADDNASGVGAMLEVARILSEEDVFAAPVTFVAFGAEERGYDATGGTAGSAFFASDAAEKGACIYGAFVMDMIGYSSAGDDVTTVVSDGLSDELYHSLVNASVRYDIDLDIRFVMDPLLRYSDHRSFWDNSYPSVLIIEEIDVETYAPANPCYHTPCDRADILSDGQMAAVSKTLLGALLDLTNQGEDSYAKSNVGAIALISITIIAAVSIAIFYLRSRRGVE